VYDKYNLEQECPNNKQLVKIVHTFPSRHH
jgi:hypothetical protein